MGMGAAMELINRYLFISLFASGLASYNFDPLTPKSLIFELPDLEKICFHEYFRQPVRMLFEYKVIRGGHNDIDASVISPNGKIMYKEKKQHSGSYELETSRGSFSFCFGNEFSTISHKRVYFSLKPTKTAQLAAEAGNYVPTVHTSGDMSAESIHGHMTEVVGFQRDYRLKESMGQHVAEGLGYTVLLWSLIQTTLFLLVGFGQVWVLKTFFTEKMPSSSDAEMQS